jgi:glucose-1-phosphate cytidylyltransferase
MKAVILAGGRGTRLSEETEFRPKPMVEIGGKPILWHIMKTYSFYGINDFIICLGYKGYMIKEFFANYFLHVSDLTIDIQKNDITTIKSKTEPWKVTLVDTGENTMTGGRIKRLIDMDISKSIKFHKDNNFIATVTAVQAPGRFGALNITENKVTSFTEKPKGDSSWINGGYFVMEPSFIKYIKDDSTILEKVPLEKVAEEGNLGVFKHDGFWQPMDTMREQNYLEELWRSNKAYWKKW